MIGIASTLALAWASFVLVRGAQRWIGAGRGACWVAMAAVVGLGQWAVNYWIGNPILSPIVVGVLYLLSLIGLAPDETVLARQASVPSRWFRRGLIAAAAGTLAGMAIWAVLMWHELMP